MIPPPPGSNTGALQRSFAFRVDLWGLRGAIQRGGQRERVNFGHSFSSLIRRLSLI
ncbi:hypothetical protein [Klebsiella pneumoniae IS39]|nr:hypothetical protein [Klebsiella pneumoniae IS39]